MTRENINKLKEKYPAGTRLVIDYMVDKYPIESGTAGTVKVVDDFGQIHMRWDNGRVLPIIPETDKFHLE